MMHLPRAPSKSVSDIICPSLFIGDNRHLGRTDAGNPSKRKKASKNKKTKTSVEQEEDSEVEDSDGEYALWPFH